jgi:hypothetical protein
MDDTPRMRPAKKIYEDMLNEPTRPSAGHTTNPMDMANKMFAPVKKAKGGSIKPVGYTKEKVTVSPSLDRMEYELMSMKHFKKAK